MSDKSFPPRVSGRIRKSTASMESRFLRPHYLLFFFFVLLISVLFIVTDLNTITITGILLSTLLSSLIFVVNFWLGYTFIKVYFLKKAYYRFKSVILLCVSYIVTPLLLGYVVYEIFPQIADNRILNKEFSSFITLVLGINFLANTLLLLFYGSNTTVVDFANEVESRKLFPDLESEEDTVSMDNQGKTSKVEPFTANIPATQETETESTTSGEDKKRYLIFQRNRILYRVKFTSIVYLEVDLNTVFLQTTKEFYEMRSTLGDIMVGLPNNFFQVNKSIVINLDYFDQLIFENETKRSKVKVKFIQDEEEMEESFYVGRKYLQELKQILAK